MSFALGAAALALVTAWTCALPGVLVVLRRQSMLVDAISHAVLPGIVLGYALTLDLGSPLVVVGAALSGLVVATGAELLARTGLVTGDAPQALIFPALFALGVILVSSSFSDLHLDTHAVLVGDLNLAAITTVTLPGGLVVPEYLLLMLGLLVIAAVTLGALRRPLTAAALDPVFAASAGWRPRLLGACFLVLVSVIVTASFHAAGAILVLALVVAPAATARLVTRSLPAMMGVTLLVATLGSLGGFGLAYVTGTPTSAGMSVVLGLIVAAVWLATRVAGRRARRRALRSAQRAHAHGVGGGGPQAQRAGGSLEEHVAVP